MFPGTHQFLKVIKNGTHARSGVAPGCSEKKRGNRGPAPRRVLRCASVLDQRLKHNSQEVVLPLITF
jgi:hypothetical protein